MYMFLGILCWAFYYFGGHVTAWIIAGAICILAEGINDVVTGMKSRGKDHDATIKKCVDDYRVTLKEINAKNNTITVTSYSGVSESVDSPDVDRL